MIAATFGEWLTEVWNTEMWSWEGFFFVLVIVLVFGR